ncbi:MAG: sulfurtransferase TusA family protein [SAR324 cluster bacterium]|nr:sulfurtransferase TusA family protein [SAR324 cluster bacterium]
MNFYHLPASLDQDIDKLEEQIADFNRGDLAPPKFKAIRVAHGIYEQRESGTFMMRARATQGAMTPAQLIKIAEVSENYACDRLHATTRQEFQLSFLKLEDLITVTKELKSVGLSGRAGGGNTTRNMSVSYDAGVNPEDVFDVAPYALALTTLFIAEADSYNMPLKLKISFSANKTDSAKATLTCLGFLAKIQDGKKGFKVYVGGGTGSAIKYGKVLLDWIPEHRVYYVAKAIKVLFDENGNRKQRNRAKIKWLVERMGQEDFTSLFYKYYALLQQELGLELDLEIFPNRSQVSSALKIEEANDPTAFKLWQERYVKDQKQDGLAQVRIPLKFGILKNSDAKKMGEFLSDFGENVIRLSPDQNFNLRNIPNEYLGNVFNFLKTLDTGAFEPVFFGSMIACTGAANCTLGVTLARPLTEAVQTELIKRNLDTEEFAGISFNVSGCPNACSNNHVADIGFFGKALKRNQHLYPAYVIQLGGHLGDGTTETAARAATAAAKDIPVLMGDFFAHYKANKAELGDFREYLKSESAFFLIKELAQKYDKTMPDLEENADYYHDWSDENRFSLLKGKKAECSAGLYDMIDYDFTEIRTIQKALDAKEIAEDTAAYRLTLHASRSLLVTQGIEAESDPQVFEAFIKDFIGGRIVSKEFQPLVEAALAATSKKLDGHLQPALDLAKLMLGLYHSMDDSLRFHLDDLIHAEEEEDAISEGTAVSLEQRAVYKDFRNVKCPMNFVKTKIALDPMKAGEILEILLDDGEPIANVPGSVELEGHEILSQEQAADGHWAVVIKKAQV